jgi:hypothetical protein
MKREDYQAIALSLFNNGQISEETYEEMIINADYFCDKDEEYGFPSTYAEI